MRFDSKLSVAEGPAGGRQAAEELRSRAIGEAVSNSVEEKEAYEVLLSRANKRTGDVSAPALVKHILTVTRGADWPVQREAMEALLRRFGFVKRDGLRVTASPARGEVFGRYETGRPRSDARPYRTVLDSVDPPRGSCDCPDFLRNSLGLCKHLLVVLESIASRPRALKQALAGAGSRERAASPLLFWDSVRPLTGPGDWLQGVRWSGGAADAGRGWLRRDGNGEESEVLALEETFRDRPARRLSLVRDLLAFARETSRGFHGARSEADPALLALLKKEEAHLERRLRDSLAPKEIKEALRSLKVPLYPYQREGVERFLAATRLLLADDMGLGKTAQAIAICHVLWKAGRVRRGLLIVPASLKPQWLREWRLFTDVPAAIVEGGPDERRRAFRATREGFLIANYEQLLRDLEVIHGWRPDIVVLDEAQRIKTWSTKTALTIKQLSPRHRLVLTGTPMENRLEELASILDWVDDFALEPKWRLVPWHSAFADGKGEVAGARNLDTLRERLAHCMVRRVRKEVLAQLPARTDTRVAVEMTEEQLSEHDGLNQPIASLVNTAKRRPLSQPEFLKLMMLLTKQRMISNGLAQVRYEEVWPEVSKIDRPSESVLKGLSSPKLLELRELVAQVVAGHGRKAVIFSQWVRMLRFAHWAVKPILDDCGARAVFFTGDEGQRRRTQNIVDFHDEADIRVLFATDAGGVGLNLQRAASCVINIEMPWNPAVLEQRIGRIYRLGQKLPIEVYNLISETGIEARIHQVVGNKKAFFTGLFDGTSNEVRFDGGGGFISRIEKVVEMPKVPRLPVEADADGAAEVEEAAERARDSKPAAGDEPAASRAAAVEAGPVARTARGGSPPAPLSAPEVRRLFSQLEVRPTERGGIAIEAPREAAAALAALFEGMAKMLTGAARR